MSWKDVGFVLKSKQRKEIIMLLETPKTPTQIAKTMKSSLSNTSLKLRDLVNAGLAECVNPNEGKGRIYRLTAKGESTLKSLRTMGN